MFISKYTFLIKVTSVSLENFDKKDFQSIIQASNKFPNKIRIPNIKIYYKSTIVRIVCDYYRDRLTDQHVIYIYLYKNFKYIVKHIKIRSMIQVIREIIQHHEILYDGSIKCKKIIGYKDKKK